MADELITITFVSPTDSNKISRVIAESSDKVTAYIGKASKDLFGLLPRQVGLTTNDGQIVANWGNMTVEQLVDTYNTTYFIVTTPDILGADRQIGFFMLSPPLCLSPFSSPLFLESKVSSPSQKRRNNSFSSLMGQIVDQFFSCADGKMR